MRVAGGAPGPTRPPAGTIPRFGRRAGPSPVGPGSARSFSTLSDGG